MKNAFSFKTWFTPPIFLLFILLNFDGTATPNSDGDLVLEAVNRKIVDSSVVPTADTLWDQTGNPAAGCSPSQNFTDLEALVQAADDFHVSNATGWTIEAVYVDGVYSPGDGPADSWDIYIYEDAEGGPGDLVYSDFDLAATAQSSRRITISSAICPAAN
jgi:hypothetical protein